MDHIDLVASQVSFPTIGEEEGTCRITGKKGKNKLDIIN